MEGGAAAPEAYDTHAVTDLAPAGHWVCFCLLDEKNQPLKGFEISVQNSGKPFKQITDDKGNAYIRGLGDGKCKVITIKGGNLYEFVSLKSGPGP